MIKPGFVPGGHPLGDYYGWPICYYLAACLGLHEELLVLIQRWDAEFCKTYFNGPDYAQLLVFGLADARLVEAEMRRLHLSLFCYYEYPSCAYFITPWLAQTEWHALDLVRDAIVSAMNKDDAASHMEQFTRVKAPEAAPFMLELKLSSKAPQLARQWLDEQVGNGIAGLIPVAAGRGKLATAALDYLREKKQQGHEQLIRACLKTAAPDVADKIRGEVLERIEKVYAPLDDKTTPGALKSALKEAGKLQPIKDANWVQASKLPPLVVGERRLHDEQVATTLAALQNSAFGKPHALISGLKQHAGHESLDAFAWALFEQWLTEGAPAKQKWAMLALGFFGSDASALKLTPLVRAWPGESQHQRAVLGLECLRAIGTDTALMQLNGIAQKLKFKGLQNKARESMEAIAQDKGLTKAQLEDRIVPDCGLDERGGRVFDFGPRKFRFLLGPNMKPMVKDDKDAVKPDLPKPGAKDAPALAGPALQEWKLLKKQVAEVAKIQAVRLEQSMVTGRRWPAAEFETLLVRQPLMSHLVRLLLWGGFKKDQLAATFRVTEDLTYADVKDESYSLKGVETVDIVHPLHLSEDLKRSWGEIFSDYEIIPPFPQLGRPVHGLDKGEKKATVIDRWKGLMIPAISLASTLEKLGWTRGALGDHGDFYEHVKYFESADVTAVIMYEDGIMVGSMVDSADQKLTLSCFLPGLYKPKSFPSHAKGIALGKVDPVVLSEVLTDLTAVAAKGK